jgi:hypothetical protein
MVGLRAMLLSVQQLESHAFSKSVSIFNFPAMTGFLSLFKLT